MSLRKPLPVTAQITLVCGTVAALLYPWTVLSVTEDVVVRWRLLLDSPGIAAVYAYSLVACLVETVVVTGFIVLLGALLPRIALREDFGVRGSLVAISLLAPLMALTLEPPGMGPPQHYLELLGTAVGLSLVSVFLAASVPFVRKAVSALVERLSVLLFLYGPLTGLALLYVIARNLGQGGS